MNYGSEWRERRRMFYQHFHPATPHRLVSVRASHSLVNQLVKDTDTRAHNERLRHFAGSIIMMIVYVFIYISAEDFLLTYSEAMVTCLKYAMTP